MLSNISFQVILLFNVLNNFLLNRLSANENKIKKTSEKVFQVYVHKKKDRKRKSRALPDKFSLIKTGAEIMRFAV